MSKLLKIIKLKKNKSIANPINQFNKLCYNNRNLKLNVNLEEPN